jgi:hypothetical protein
VTVGVTDPFWQLPYSGRKKTEDKVERACNMATHALFESASGYAIFEVKFAEEIGAKSSSVQDSIKDLAKFGKMVNLLSFLPFKSAAQALENANDISEGDYRQRVELRSCTDEGS